jgi:outer membrane protein OmpA-like peptidoglycan-associated protein
MTPRILAVVLLIIIANTSFSQEKRKSNMPLFVSHLSEENAAVTRRKGAPKHYFLSRVICFNKKCRGFIGWRTHQRRMRYEYTKPSKQKAKLNVAFDTTKIKQDKPIKKMPVKETSAPIASPVQADSVIVLSEVLFETNSYHLREDLYPTLDSIANYLRKESKSTAIVSGHTDNTGKESYNLQLSSQRAEAVAEYLLDRGIDPERVTFIGFGSAVAIQPNETLEGRRKNRRVEILIKRKR